MYFRSVPFRAPEYKQGSGAAEQRLEVGMVGSKRRMTGIQANSNRKRFNLLMK